MLEGTSSVAAGAALTCAGVAGSAAAASGQTVAGARVPFGACVRPDVLKRDPRYRAALAGYCQQIVPEGSLKWGDIRPARGQFNFADADAIFAFARERGLTMRGHTLCWYEANPPWVKEIASKAEAERELVNHIEIVVSRYKGHVRSWDVVNEPLEDKARTATDQRDSIWRRHLGDDYIRIAFEAARRVDPNLELVINEYGIESVGDQDTNKRAAYLDLIKRLRDRGVPIDAAGIQGHLRGDHAIDRDGVSKFTQDVKSLGLKLLITELDVTDDTLPATIKLRDETCALRVRELLGSVFQVARPAAVLTWGITDSHTWVPMWFKRKDGLPNRPLPLDADFKPKPMMDVIAEFCRATT